MPKSPSDSDATVRKRRNARGQAAFRAKRSQYMTSLEETVLRLENALVTYQDEWRKHQDEIYQMKEENEKMRQEQREHELLLETLYRRGEAPELADLLQSDPSLSPIMGDVIKLLPISPSSGRRSTENSPTYLVSPSNYEGRSSSSADSISQSPFPLPHVGVSTGEHFGPPVTYNTFQYPSNQLSEVDGWPPQSRPMNM
ncbi:hypothetical protein CPB84DRAFT_1776314 [Gymnopilus junonius]|uniref:BZIP domain-containing protein n=1 Tax=Gymnopilus junonius TaxID=109634 RepID=A0A9P5NRL4_GYMJU|nr:hypothetical protein CPB84DRAFT_1776314 [Gymnopilus junonius]